MEERDTTMGTHLSNRHTSGLLVLGKPSGISSRAAVNHICRMFVRWKVGHAGTLDPMASGVLVLCVGKATRLIPYVQKMPKQYVATVRFGQRSATHDLESAVENVAHASITRRELEGLLAQFRGEILQVPPQYSAVHVSGHRAYAIARDGGSARLNARPVTIHCLECASFEWPDVMLNITCGSGTYVRSIARDLGEQLGCGAVLASLVRTAVGPFSIADALELDHANRSSVLQRLLPSRAAVADLPVFTVPTEQHDDVAHGRPIPVPSLPRSAMDQVQIVLADEQGDALAIATLDASRQRACPKLVLLHRE